MYLLQIIIIISFYLRAGREREREKYDTSDNGHNDKKENSRQTSNKV